MKRANYHLRHAVKGGTTRLRRQEPALPPPVAPDNHDGMLRIESRELVPPALIEGDEANEPLFGPIMWLVIILGSAFIAMIAWLVRDRQ